MSNDLHQCPNCGAYVTSGSSTCPRCDHPLEPDEAARARAELPTDIIDPVIADSSEPLETEESADTGESAESGQLVDEPLNEAVAETLRMPGDEGAAFALPPEPEDSASSPEDYAPVEDAAQDALAQEFAPDEGVFEAEPALRLEDTAEMQAIEAPAEAALSEATEEAEPAEEVKPAEKVKPAESAILAEPGLDPEAATGPGDILPPPAEEQVVIRRPTALTPQPVAVQFPVESVTTVSGSTPRHAPAAPEPTLPPAPFTPPPPVLIQPPQPTYQPYSAAAMQSAGIAYVQQRVQAYLHGGYRIVTHAPHEATLARGKSMSVGGWLLALVTVIGAVWYLLILAVSGFKPDRAYLVLETDGRVYEDGPGAAHVRDARSRAGRRGALLGLLLVVICGVVVLALAATAIITLSQDRYQAALRAAYPAVTLFEERLSDAPASPEDVDLAKTGSVVFAVVGGIALIGLWAGATLFVIGTVQANAYRVQVPPLPANG